MNRCVVPKRVVALASLIAACGLAAPVYSKERLDGHTRRAVNQIVPLSDGSLLIVNDYYRRLFKTTDGGKHWRKLRERDSRRALWAGGNGAFQLLDGAWVRMWQDDLQKVLPGGSR